MFVPVINAEVPWQKLFFRDIISKEPELSSVGIDIKSAGTIQGIDGAPATSEAVAVMREHGIDISQHKAKHINTELVNWADIILVMKPEHRTYIIAIFGDDGNKIHLLTHFVGEPGYVADPIGLGLEAYRQCADQLLVLLTSLKKRIF